jgi:hypothetical protein
MAGFYTARSRTIPPLPWPSFAPPFSSAENSGFQVRIFRRGKIYITPACIVTLE